MFSLETLLEIVALLKDADISSATELKQHLPLPIRYRVEIEFVDNEELNVNILYADLGKALELYDKYRYTQFACGKLIDYKSGKVLSAYCNDWEELRFYD